MMKQRILFTALAAAALATPAMIVPALFTPAAAQAAFVRFGAWLNWGGKSARIP